MDYTDRYINRLKRKGTNSINATINKSKQVINDKFNTSPSFVIVRLNGVDTDSIVNNDTKHDEKLIFFRPDVTVDIGSIIEYKSSNYLLMSFVDNDISPKGELKLCNSTFPIQSNKTSVFIGNDPNTGRPVYSEQEGTQIITPCIVESKYTKSTDTDQLMIPEGNIVITMKYQTAENLVKNFEFEMYGNKYKIADFDLTKVIVNKGIMKIIAEKVV